MPTYFDSIKKVVFILLSQSTISDKHPYLSDKNFTDVPVTDAGVDTVAFLEAAEGLVGLFGAL